MFPRDDMMVPVMLLSDNNRYESNDMLPISSGMVPYIPRLLYMYISRNLVQQLMLRDDSGEHVVTQVNALEELEGADAGWDLALKAVAFQVEGLQEGENPDGRGDVPVSP
jgi:hypothetical protein